MTKRFIWTIVLAGAMVTGCGGGGGGGGGLEAETSKEAQSPDALFGDDFQTMSAVNAVDLVDLSERLNEASELNAAEMKASAAAELRKAAPSTSSQLTVHRFWNANKGSHFYTASESERELVTGSLSAFTYEGPAFHAFASQAMGLSPVHRFYNTLSGTHFYTISDDEKAFIEASVPELRYEGQAYHAAKAPLTGFVPAYRFLHNAKATHFYTRSEAERDQLSNTDSGYTYEGVAYYVLPSVDRSAPVVADVFPAAGESVPTTVTHVSGKVSDNVAVKSVAVVIGGTIVPATITAGEFSAKLPLQPGLNNYTVVSEDYAGNRLDLPASAYLGSRVAGGGSHSGAIKGGLLFTVGRNNTGQLGFGDITVLADNVAGQPEVHPNSMRQISHGAQRPVSLMFNQNFSLMLDSAGTVWSWGTNTSGQLGVGACSDPSDSSNRLVPTLVTGLTSVVTIAAGYDHSLALKNDGTVWAFGKNSLGQLGDGSTADRDCPVQVQGLPMDARVIQVMASSASSYALDDQGRVWAWGRNQYGNLGQGTISTSSTVQSSPLLVPLTAKVSMLANGRDHVLALTESGAVIGWGLNASSQLSNAWASPVSTPAELPALPAQSTRRVWANGNSSWVMKEIGIPYRWGQRLGNRDTDFPTANLPEPELVSADLTGVIDIGMGASHWVVLNGLSEYASLGWSFQGSLGGGPSTIPTWAYVEPIVVMFP